MFMLIKQLMVERDDLIKWLTTFVTTENNTQATLGTVFLNRRGKSHYHVNYFLN